MKDQIKWSGFSDELSRIFFFWCFGILYFLLFRLIFILFFINQLDGQSQWIDIYKTFLMGFRFDATVIAYFILFPILSIFLFAPFGQLDIARYIRKIFQILFALAATFICVVTINYFQEYSDQFNHFLFVGLYDDQKAVLETIIAHFNPILNMTIILTVVIISIFIFRYLERKNGISGLLKKIKSTPFRILLVLIILFLFIGSIRGSFRNRPAMRKWSSVSRDPFLNKTVINPFRSLVYAISDFNKINRDYGTNPFGAVGDHISREDNKTVTSIIKKRSIGRKVEKPEHIFIVVMESYDYWPFLEEYEEFGVANKLKAIANEGTAFTNFLPSSASTMNSFGALITGIPYTGVNISKIGAINDPYPGSIFDQFENLGYETNFFYGGYLSWQNIGNLVKNQGGDNLYSAADAGGKTESGIWGIEDDKLFNLVLDTINKDRPSLNVILTTSYHPPYSINIESMGFPYKTKDDLPLKAQAQYSDAMSIKALGHLWYSDLAIGDFVSAAENKYPKSIFCFTGDHFGRRFINSQPNLLERTNVPFIIYGFGVEPQINDTPGSHIDIIPTLVEMVAPENFIYYSFGNSLLHNHENKLGVGYLKIISKNELQYFAKNSDIQVYDINSGKTSYIRKSEYDTEYRKLLSLAWHYTIKGDSLNNL